MTEETKRAREALKEIRGDHVDLAVYINRCNLDETDLYILRHKLLKHESLVKISLDLQMNYSNVSERYCNALLTLVSVAKRYRKRTEK